MRLREKVADASDEFLGERNEIWVIWLHDEMIMMWGGWKKDEGRNITWMWFGGDKESEALIGTESCELYEREKYGLWAEKKIRSKNASREKVKAKQQTMQKKTKDKS